MQSGPVGNDGQLQQTLTLGAGIYQVRLRVAQRTCCSTNDQRLSVLIDGTSVGTLQPTNTSGYDTYTSSSFVVDVPTVTTAAASGVTSVRAVLGGNVTAAGSATVTARGVVYSSTDNTPNIGESGVIQDANPTAGTGAFSETIAGLTGATTYYMSAYATNSYGTSYGSVASFTTLAALSTTGTQANVNCNGGSNGSATVTVSGGVAPYSYSWSPSGGTGATASNLTAGTYTVTVNDAGGASITRNFTITQPSAPVSGTSVVTNVACFGGSTGAINLTPTGGTAPYTFNWGSGVTTEDRTGLAAGTYTVVITDANSCTATRNITVSQPTSPISGTTVVWNVACFGGSNGRINLTPTGGTGPYTYNWAGGPTTEDRTGLIAGTYTVTITDANGCTGTVTATVTQPAEALTVTPVSQTNVSCNGGSTGAATVSVTGGTAPYTYSWSPSGGTAATASNLTAGTYTVTVADANGCTAQRSFTLTQPSSVNTSTIVTNIACYGGNTGVINLNPVGGTAPYTFNWGGGITTEDRTGLTAGNYNVVITDANGCSITRSYTVNQPSTPVTATGSQTNVTTFGAADGTATVTAAGGEPYSGYAYNWARLSAPAGSLNQYTATATGLTAGTYRATVYDGNSCTATVDFTITQPAATALTAVAPNPGGLGQSIALTGTNLSNPTALTVNGANGLTGILSNTGSSLVVRVPMTATASGTVSITTANGTASLPFTLLPAPGNALALDGANDYVRVPDHSSLDFGSGNFTVEAWVLKQANSIGYGQAVAPGGKWNTGATSGTNEWLLQTTSDGNNNIPSFWVESGTTLHTVSATTPMTLGRWYHLAGVRSGGSLLLYVDGVLQGTTAIPAAAAVNNITGRDLLLGAIANNSTNSAAYFANVRLDELRIWNVARSAAELQASMISTVAATAPGLVAYYNFDAGTAGGDNTGLTTLYDLTANANHGTLTNFGSPGLGSGNTTSNWVESYALVVPTATAATARTAAGFTATWTAPTLGTVNTYAVDVATNATFTTNLTTRNVTAPATSVAITGLAANTTYYYRVRADKTSVTGQGAYSNTVTVCPLPVALTRNASVTLGANGNATVAATDVNNSSTANCGTAAADALSVSPSNFSCADAVPATVASSLTFNGTNQYVSIPATATVPVGNSSYTIEAWIRPTQMGTYGIIGWGNYGTNNQVNALRLSPSGLINYWWANDLILSTGNLAGAWHHVAATFDGTTRTIYLNGVAIGSDTPTGHAVPNANNLRIGSTNNGEYFPGSIDEVRVWNVARTAAQLNAAKGAGLPGGTAGLVAYYRLNEGSGLSAADATGTAANQGTLANNPTWSTAAAPVTNGLPVTLTVTDAGGNTATGSAIVTVTDNIAPAAVAQNVTVALTSGGTATVTAAQVNNNSTDNCSVSAVGLLSPTDLVANGTFNTNATGWSLANNAEYRSSGGNPGGYVWLNSVGTAGTDPTATQTLTGLTVGTTYQISGSYRNDANCCGAGVGAIAFGIDVGGTQVATLPDPGLTWTPFTVYFTATATSQALAFRGEINSTDVDIAIDNISVRAVASSLSFACAQIGANPVTLLVTDASGNRSTASATVTVQDNTGPTVVAQNVSVTVDNTGRAYVAPTSVNNGSADNCTLGDVALSASSFGPCAASAGLALDGTNDYVSLPAGLLGSAQSFTFEAWVNYQDNGVWTRIFDFGSSTNVNMFLTPRANWNAASVDKLAFGITTGSSAGEQRIVGNTGMPTGWHHVAVSMAWNATTSQAVGTLYLDGAVVGTNANMTLNPALLGTLNNVWLGRSQYGQDPYLKGQIDEVRIWNVARTAAQINLFDDKSLAGNTTGLLAYYDFNGAPGSTVADRTTAGRTATLLNFDQVGTAFQAPGQVPALGVGAQTVTLTVTDALGNVSNATATVTVNEPVQTTVTWTGAVSTDWADCRNWSFGKQPSTALGVNIPTGLSRYPTLGSGTGSANDLTVATSAVLTQATGAVLNVAGNFQQNGTATLNGTVAFVGTGTQTIGGSATPSFTTLTVNKPNGTLQLQRNVTVGQALNLTTGTLLTEANKITLGSTATITESSSSYVTGTVETTRALNVAGTRQTFGGLGLALTPSGTTLPGTTTVSRVTGTALSGQGTSTSIKRYYDVTAQTNTGLNVTLEFGYADVELNGFTESSLGLFRSTTGTAGPWQFVAAASRDANANVVTATGVTGFSVWTLGTAANPLPVELVSFTAERRGADAVLRWATAQERDNAYFVLESSLDGRQFAAVTQVPGRGTSTQRNDYQWVDAGLARYRAAAVYYRLRQVDTDGTEHLSPVRVLALEEAGVALRVFPNPARSQATVTGVAPGAAVSVYDVAGRLVQQLTADAAGAARLQLPAALPSGVYLVRSGPQVQRLVIE
ncbi:LamG-like jellyroll fold domain-containing protein [Hymenobacter oligotrophus]|uniref:LamG-like jellyroll fold domain-containing protein n=1 Tax=Hymenobacter oligotrophus TaxID=2319843 RepID=UPI0013C2AEBE|nr:LamG-like jellyroll fold domain-containing protein [Hymenobacter oligotrophus]